MISLGLGDTPPDAVPHPELTPHQEIARRILGAAQSLRPKMVIYSILMESSGMSLKHMDIAPDSWLLFHMQESFQQTMWPKWEPFLSQVEKAT